LPLDYPNTTCGATPTTATQMGNRHTGRHRKIEQVHRVDKRNVDLVRPDERFGHQQIVSGAPMPSGILPSPPSQHSDTPTQPVSPKVDTEGSQRAASSYALSAKRHQESVGDRPRPASPPVCADMGGPFDCLDVNERRNPVPEPHAPTTGGTISPSRLRSSA
jgi:hypothetical protein